MSGEQELPATLSEAHELIATLNAQLCTLRDTVIQVDSIEAKNKACLPRNAFVDLWILTCLPSHAICRNPGEQNIDAETSAAHRTAQAEAKVLQPLLSMGRLDFSAEPAIHVTQGGQGHPRFSNTP